MMLALRSDCISVCMGCRVGCAVILCARHQPECAGNAQMVMPALRSDSALITFRRKLEKFDFNMSAWRRDQARAQI